MNIEKFKKDLERVMKEKEVNQVDLASITGVSQSSLSLFLANKRGLSGINILKLAGFVYGEKLFKKNTNA